MIFFVFQGTFLNCLKKANKSAQELLKLVTTDFPCFYDSAYYCEKKGRKSFQIICLGVIFRKYSLIQLYFMFCFLVLYFITNPYSLSFWCFPNNLLKVHTEYVNFIFSNFIPMNISIVLFCICFILFCICLKYKVFTFSVTFHKRAQILIGDLWCLNYGEGISTFTDIDTISMFADYRYNLF